MIQVKPHELIVLAKPYIPTSPHILEAGSFDGKDTKKIITLFSKATIYAFEPVPELFKKLTNNVSAYPTIYTYNYALSDTVGTETFYISEKPEKPGIASQAGSLREPKERLVRSPIIFPRTTTVQTTTIDEWANKHSVNHIDFMWLDMQGHELTALKGSTKILASTSALVVEVSFIEGYKDQPLMNDVITWLYTQNFIPIARDFSEPSSWFFGNILFVKQHLVK